MLDPRALPSEPLPLMTAATPTASSSPPPALRTWLRDAARRHPERAALETPEGTLDYAALVRAVDALSDELRAAHVVAGDRLAIAASRTASTVVAIAAAVDAGVAYVPLDLAYPAERLSAMLEDARPRAVVGEEGALAELRSLVGEVPSLARPAPATGEVHAAAPDLAYVLFTSGSTGRPKGVAMGAAPLDHLTRWHARHPRLGLPARTLQFAPLSFDVHFQEIFSTWACGGTLVMLPERERRDPSLLHAALVKHRIERVFVPYVALSLIAEACGSAVPPALRDVISAGEQLQVTPAIRAMFERLDGAELHNHYGPTESHVVTAFELRGDPRSWPEIPPIGVALPHVELALVTPGTRTVTHGDTGELLLGGDTLAHGYLARPELSAERFVSEVEGLPGRWYLTGDLVRRDGAGVCTYLGRADQQLKVDGFRIEPGEIELCLLTHEAVREAVVTAPEIPGVGRQLIAHVVLRAALPELGAALRGHVRAHLPEYMVPVRFVALERLPTTPSGKLDRKGLPLPAPEPALAGATLGADPIEVVRGLWKELLGVSSLGDDDNVFELGARSLLVLRFVARLTDHALSGLSVADVYDRPTVAGMAASLTGAARRAAPGHARRRERGTSDRIALVGMATRTAGARDVEAFWQSLLAGQEGIRHFAPHELDPSVPEGLKSHPNFVAARGVLDDVDRFDAKFFEVPPREATVIDPQQRMFLELSWAALEHAGIDPAASDDRVGVYAGTANNTYIVALREEQPELVRQFSEFATMLASEKDYVATRVAHRLNLTGPAVSIHTACSTGLTAVGHAFHALASGQCDVALAGGTTVMVPQESGYLHVEGGMESADGTCRPFDADATGTVFASAGAVVVLKRLEDALAAGDTIYAVLSGVGLNNDGGNKASFTAPSVSGQAAAIRMALDHAAIDARSVGYVEAHGTGTALGDPIEVAGLTRAFEADTDERGFAWLGSLKSNLGHTIAAAGVLGLIKAALALHHEVIPATLHYRRPNPQIELAKTPFRVVAENTPWPRGATPRRAGVSSFGVGGTNVHVIVEEAPEVGRAPATENRLHLLPLSAKTITATEARARDLAAFLERHPDVALGDVAATLMRGRRPMGCRAAVVASDVNEAVAALRVARAEEAADKPRVVFLFPGQGSQHPGMARGLCEQAPAFREAFERCLGAMPTELAGQLRGWLVDAPPDDGVVGELLAQTRHAQPALFCMSFALAAWLESLGVRPDAMIGHSIGELAAACRAGVMSVEAACALVVARGEAMWAEPRGSMLAVRSGAEALASRLTPGVEIAGQNAPELTVVAGPHEAVDAFATALEAEGIGATRLKVSHAFHSAAMEGAMEAITRAASALPRAPAATPVYSCVSGLPLAPSEATDAAYWARQMRSPVQFSAAVQHVLDQGDALFVEVGPSQALSALIRRHRTARGPARAIPLLGRAQEPGEPMKAALEGLGALFRAGVRVAWPVPTTARRVALPTYPFEGERYWFSRRAPASTADAQPAASSALPAPVAAVPSTPSSPLPPSLAVAPTPAPTLPSPADQGARMSRLPSLQRELKRILCDVSGIPTEDLGADDCFVDQGLDSLSMTQATLELGRVFGVKLRMRRLMEDLDSVAKLAAFLDAELPPDAFAPEPEAPAAPSAVSGVSSAAAAAPALPLAMAPGLLASLGAVPALPAGGAGVVSQLIQQQMLLMQQQLALLAGQPLAGMSLPVAATPQPPEPPPKVAPAAAGAPLTVDAPADGDKVEEPSRMALLDKPFGASARINLRLAELTPAQGRWLDDFIRRYTARTQRSKTFTQKHRKLMADPRVVTGFNPEWKDLVYPIVADRSSGARIWDIDGNEYIDLLSCFGANLLGYQPPDVVAAMTEQLQAGIEVGPQHPLAAEVSELISELTGMERVAFCNTGSEAVMGAMRIARTVTGRKTIAIFTDSYHGIFDEVIVRGNKALRSLSAAPGILASAVQNVLVLDYGSEESLRVLRERGPELAAIMIEPIQNKHPTFHPRAFVKELRKICDEHEAALIFDEVVTGFRVARGGAQEFYDVRADIATYGKVIGGGLPFAAIAGGSHWLDALDGGHWQYGDASFPEAGVTYFAGTFVRHPLALAAAKASLLHLKARGRELYQVLNARTERLANRLNAAFAERGALVRVVHCASLWRLSWEEDNKFISLFYYLLRYHGLHVYEQFGHFVTDAMDDGVIAQIGDVVLQSIDELLELGFLNRREGAAAGEGAARTTGLKEAPLSPGQTERWLAASYDAAARRALNESFCVALRGDVKLPELRAAVSDVLSRHDAFRVRFSAEEPLQRLAPPGEIPIEEVDLRHEPDADAALDAFSTEASGHTFALETAPLARVSLLALADGRLVVHVVANHLVFDGWAASVFVAELAETLRARQKGVTPKLARPESPLDFGAAEVERFEGPEGEESLAYWRALLAQPPPPLALGDRTPPTPRAYEADTERARLEGELFARLRARARRSGVTMFQLLLGAVTIMLHRESGRDEFLVSIPFASQSLDRHGPLMADGVLDLPLLLVCRPGDDGARVVQRVRSQLMDALEHPLVTQGTIARALGLRSSGDRAALTGVFFNLNPKVDLSGFAPLEATMHEGRKRGTLSELFFNFYEQDDALTLDLHYGTEHVSPPRARALVDALFAVVGELAASLGEPVGGASAPATEPPPTGVAPPAVDPRLTGWNATATALAAEARVERWVDRQCLATPDTIAVVAGGTSMTYRELARRKNRIANVLAARGVGPGMRVGVCLGRGPELLPALLGVLATGAAYVPLDPGFPRERLHDMVEDAAVRLVITEGAHADMAGVGRDQQLRIDDDAAVIAGASAAPLERELSDPDATMYVIYTSGSTGRPKGVVLPHRAVVNFLASMRKAPGLTANDRLLAVTTLSFDIAVLELFLPLVTGARVVLALREEAMDGEALRRLLDEHDINVMQATPTTWHLLVDAGWRPKLPFRVLCGGEALPPSLAVSLSGLGVELWNMYGPTETTVWSTIARIDDPTQRITIGRPIDNTEVWVLDEEQRPCPVGAEGELCIGGAGVATGYHNRPDLTAERFVPDPFSERPGARLYRTGDLGRWRDDGTLEHLGRLDFQVKIRGYRIELGEIEARLAALPGVSRAVVVAREDTPSDVRLVGYVVVDPGARHDARELRKNLRKTLPDYMLPAHIVTLDALPLLPNGKIDRKALPAPTEPSSTRARDGVEPPRTDVERAIAVAMQAVLKVPEVGRGDDFFSLGGHSLLAARLIGMLNRELGLQLTLRVLFEAPTVEKLGQAIERERGAGGHVRAPIIHRADQRHAPLTLMQERIRFIEEMYPNRVVYNAPSAHRLIGPMNLVAFERAFVEMVRRQASLRTSIVATDGGYAQRVEPNVTVSLLPAEDLSALPKEEREARLAERIRELTAHSFVLEEGPLFRAHLFVLGEEEHVLFFLVHHVVWDGWSFDLLYKEMAILYEAYRRGEEPKLAPLPVTYGDFAAWHNEWLTSDEIQEQVRFWRDQYGIGALPRDPFADVPRQRSLAGRGGTQRMLIDRADAERYRELAKQTGTTLSIVALSVYAAIMSEWLDDPRPTIGVPVRGRPSPELEDVMGFFNNLLPLRIPVDTSLSGLDWINAVRQVVVDAYAHQDVPFELVAHELEVNRSGATRFYQVMFSFQDARHRPRNWGPLAHQRVRVDQTGATEDLNLWLVEIPAGIEAGMQYNADVFLPSTAAALRDRFLAVFEALVREPSRPLAELLAPRPAERQHLDAWNAPRSVERELPVGVASVEARVASQPQRVALRDGDTVVTYAELGERIATFGKHLGEHVRANSTVVLFVADPIAQLVAGLAALRLGVRVLSLPRELPAAAVHRLAREAQAAAVVSDSSLPSDVSSSVAWLDAAQIPGARPPDGRPRERRALDDAIGLPHHAVDRELCEHIHRALALDVHLLEGDRVLCVDGPWRAQALVLAVVALGAGGEVCFAPPSALEDGAALLRRLRDEHIALLYAPAAGWHRVLGALEAGASLSLVALVDVAEHAVAVVSGLLARGCTVVSMMRPAAWGVPLAVGHVASADESALFGRPVVPAGVVIVDAQGRELAPGMAGELRFRVGGGVVATETRARWRSDGTLQYLGELGDTVHMHGLRLDLGAIARHVAGFAGVVDAGVAVADDEAAHRRMVLCVQPKAAASFDEQACRRALEEALPPGFPPLEVLSVERVTRLSSGGVDAALVTKPRVARRIEEAEETFTPTERALAEVWEELLNIPGIRRDDNFFELGGTSLSAMQAVVKLEQRVGKRISPRRYVFETLAQLAAAYDEAGAPPLEVPGSSGVQKPALEPRGGMLSRLVKLVRGA